MIRQIRGPRKTTSTHKQPQTQETTTQCTTYILTCFLARHCTCQERNPYIQWRRPLPPDPPMYLEDNPYIDPTELCHRQTVHRWCNRLWGTIYNFLNHVHPKIYRQHNLGTIYLPISLYRANNQCMWLLQHFPLNYTKDRPKGVLQRDCRGRQCNPR